VLALGNVPDEDIATELVNAMPDINRVVGLVHARAHISELRSSPATLTHERLKRLRQADGIVRQWSEESGFDREVWQFPVVLIPIGAGDRPDSVVLRPIHSVDGMTAQVVRMPRELLHRMTHELMSVNGLCGIFYDLTHKPPGTIEWE
jgi:GMP synthase (glutamine-hydrolysing)